MYGWILIMEYEIDKILTILGTSDVSEFGTSFYFSDVSNFDTLPNSKILVVTS
jgi:hypothetical protein